jgi:iron complex outermembrane recepter protein
MKKVTVRHRPANVAFAVCACIAAAQAQAQAAGAPAATELEEVVVSGFRHSLSAALDVKRTEAGSTDTIMAEDIADFPDMNLSESIQRLPGVSITRSAGQGRNISVRGLGPQFTRVRINGMETLTTTGGTDAAGGVNRGRAFDFNIFASDLFNQITVRKTASAEVEEGSLGATVDLMAARPFDYQEFTFAAGAQLGYNDLADSFDPRFSLLVSNVFADGRVGALLSVAYSQLDLSDVGSSTVRWQNGAGFQTVAASTGYTLTQVNNAFRPRIPRYDIYSHEQERLGVTGSVQIAPSDATSINLDLMFSKLDGNRNEIFLESPNFSSAGLNQVDVLEATIDSSNSLVYGRFNDVDIRSEHRYDELSTQFLQATVDATHEFSDQWSARALAGHAISQFRNPIQTTLLWDRNDIANYVYDYRDNSRLPLISYGTTNVTDPSIWTLAEIRLRPQTVDNTFSNGLVDVTWSPSETFSLTGGLQYKKYEFDTSERRRSNGTTANQEAIRPAAVLATPRSQYAQQVALTGLGVPAGTTTQWVVPDLKEAAKLWNLYDESVWRMGIEPALGNNYAVEEQDKGAFLQADFQLELFGRGLRGNAGVRYVKTDQTSSGYTYNTGGPLLSTEEHSYSDTLPSLNLVYDLTNEMLIRLGASKVMARAGLGLLNPGAAVTVSGNNRTYVAGNPELEPTRATAYDAAFEWYFAPEALLGVALFYKDINSFVQTAREIGPFNQNPGGLPDSVAIAACGTVAGCSPSASWNFDTPVNTPGGDLQGVEVSFQAPFRFLPAPFNDFGTILNYTHVESDITYLNSAGAVVAQEQLTGLSENAANATLYFDNGTFNARVSAAYRDDYLTTVPGRNGNDVEGTVSTLNVDFSASWKVNDEFSLTLEALNLTDEFDDQWVDSAGNRLSYYHHTGRQYFVGARFRF